MSREGCEERLDPAAVGAQPPRGGASQRTLAGHWEFSKLRGSSGRWTQAGWGGSRAVGSHVVPGLQTELWSLTPRVAGGRPWASTSLSKTLSPSG